MELREGVCCWPLGDPTTPAFRYCGARAVGGLPYCAHHDQIAYQPAAKRKRYGPKLCRDTLFGVSDRKERRGRAIRRGGPKPEARSGLVAVWEPASRIILKGAALSW